MRPRRPRSTLFPYTTLFRSLRQTVSRSRGTAGWIWRGGTGSRSEEHTSELQSHSDLVCRLLLEKKTPLVSLSPHLCRSSLCAFDVGAKRPDTASAPARQRVV